MIIICPSCKKKFEVDSNLIPEIGKLLKCGSCSHTWFYKKQDETNNSNEASPIEKEETILPKIYDEKKDDIIDKDYKTSNNKGSEIVKYQPKFKLTSGKILNYLVVFIISFVALIVVLDTFKNPLSIFFPNIELILYNLFESLKDLILFIKDLN